MSDTQQNPVGFAPCDPSRSEELMLREDTVREILARLGRGESVKAIARELGVDRKTIKR
jgi:DNA-binding NarL/FixJ family response regulator